MGAYSKWKEALAASKGMEWSDTDEIAGRYRAQQPKTKPDHPVAIWPDGSGKLIVKVGDQAPFLEGSRQWDGFVNWVWPKCWPVSEEGYKAALASGVWQGDAKPARVGGAPKEGEGNAAPSDEALADQIEALAETITILTVDNQQQANAMSERLDRLRKLLAEAEAEREREKKPFLDGGREVDARWSRVVDPGKTAGNLGRDRRTAFLKKEQDRLNAEAAAENKRRAEEAAAETERKRQELAKQAEILGEAPPEIEEVKPTFVEPEKAKAGATFGRATGLTRKRVAVIDDAAKLCQHFISNNDAEFMEYLQKRAQAAVRAKAALPGVSETEELK